MNLLLSFCLCLTLASPALAELPEAPFEPTQIHQTLTQSQQNRPEWVRLVTLGHSVQKRPLELISIGAPDASSAILLIFGQHADEYDSVFAGMALLQDLLKALDTDPDWQALLRKTRLDILPMMNPDGAAAGYPKNSRVNAARVDLNRNWAYHWAPAQASGGTPSAYTRLPGPEAFSEPETRAVRDYILKHPELKLVVDYHTGQSNFSQGMVHYPYTYAAKNVLSRAEKKRFETLAQQTAQALTIDDPKQNPVEALPVHAVRAYIEAAIRDQLPPAYQEQALATLPLSFESPGSSIDWIYGQTGIPALGIEMSRPYQATSGETFVQAFKSFYAPLSSRLLGTVRLWLTL